MTTAHFPVSSPAAAHGTLPRLHAGVAPLAAALTLVLGLQATLIVLRGVHWDEFYFYGQVNDFLQGQRLDPLQTIHVRLFAWLGALPGDSIDHIRAARAAMFVCELVTVASIIGLARHFADMRTGLLAALLYVGAGYVFQHGFAFRTDPLAAAALMAALWLLVTRSLHFATLLGAGALVGFAGMVTIKVVLLAPAFAGIAWFRLAGAGAPYIRTFARLTLVGVAAAGTFAALYGWHSADQTAAETLRSTGGYASGAAGRMFLRGLAPQWPYLLECVLLAPLLFLAVALAPAELRRGGLAAPPTAALAGLWLPVLVPLFYQNSFPYFYAFILPPVAVAAAVAGLGPIRARFPDSLIAVLLALPAVGCWFAEPPGIPANQRAVIGAAREIFPQGTHYFDYCDMLSPLPKSNFFMTTWGYQGYLGTDQRDLTREMALRPVPLVLANHGLLTRAFELSRNTGTQLKPHDVEALRSTYIHHWGPLWVAGHTIPAGAARLAFFTRVPGTYTVEGAALTIDGANYARGATVTLVRGRHVAGNSSTATGTLRWGDHLPLPAYAAPTGAILRGF